MERLISEIAYEWRPFTLDGEHLTFRQHVSARLSQARCSHWGPAVYKWEGAVAQGPHSGSVGILIGETSDLRQRIKQYVSGNQERGNKLWRESFLLLGDVRLFTLDLRSLVVGGGEHPESIEPKAAIESANMRLVLEQLLVMKDVAATRDGSTWVVNARQ